MPVGDVDLYIEGKWDEVDFESNNLDLKKDIDPFQMILPPNIKDGSFEKTFRKKFKKFGLEQIQIDIIVLHFIYEYSLTEIAEHLSITSALTVYGLMKRGLDMLKAKGFK